MKHDSPFTHLDVKLLAQGAKALTGHDLLSRFERLATEASELGTDRVLNWSALGELRFDEAGAEQVWLHLTVDTSLPLACQRCLGPVDIKVAVNRSFRFVQSEQAALEQDEDAEEDILVFSPEFKLVDLIEDEVLLALPVVARHEACPVEVKLAVADPGFDTAGEEKSNPFAVLGRMQTRKTT
ncbi:MAG: YceD family protein [Comamonadaceae bacterium]